MWKICEQWWKRRKTVPHNRIKINYLHTSTKLPVCLVLCKRSKIKMMNHISTEERNELARLNDKRWWKCLRNKHKVKGDETNLCIVWLNRQWNGTKTTKHKQSSKWINWKMEYKRRERTKEHNEHIKQRHANQKPAEIARDVKFLCPWSSCSGYRTKLLNNNTKLQN